MAEAQLRIHEIFFSIQGESLLAGKPTVFVRTAACNLRCRWCDTGYAFWKGRLMSLESILDQVASYGARYVCVTGGEPLGQKGVYELMRRLAGQGYTVSLETNGSFSIRDVPPEVIKVVDVKCPDSGESDAMDWENLALVSPTDQLKFVVASRRDFDWALGIIEKYSLSDKCPLLFSPVHGKVPPVELARWILDSRAPVTFQMQMHKVIWDPKQRGV